MTSASKSAMSERTDREPTEIEALLPFHAAGTLNLRDARRVDEALATFGRYVAELEELAGA